MPFTIPNAQPVTLAAFGNVTLDRVYKNQQNSVVFGPQYYDWFDDFDKAYPLTTNLPVTATSPYNAKATSTGTFTQASPTLANGVAVLSGATTTNHSGVQIQKDTETVFLTVGNTVQAIWQWQTATPTTVEVFCGLGNQYGATGAIQNGSGSATILTNLDLTHYTDFVGIYTGYQNGGFFGVGNVTGGAAGTVTPSFGIVATSAYNLLGLEIIVTAAGVGTVNYYLNGSLVSSTAGAAIPATTKGLAPIFGMLSSSASGTITASLDFMGYVNLH